MATEVSKFNVLVSGGGIAGTVFAYWLLQAHPEASITIIERDPKLRLTGASVDIRSSAVDIIKWMGAEQTIRSQTTKEEGMQFVNENGKEIATFRATGREDVQSFTSEFEIFRGELAKIFLDLIVDRVNIIFGETVDHYEQFDDGVAVTLAKSKTTKKYDLFVGADGFYSKIRGTMMNCSPKQHIHDEGIHIAYFTIKGDLLEGSRLAKGYGGTKGRMCFLRPDPNPSGATRGNLMKIVAKGDIETKQKLDKAYGEEKERYMDLMEDIFKDMAWLTPEILKRMRDSEDFYSSVFGQIRSPILQDGRVVLLGDAGYATPGFGTSLAIIGGYILAGELLNNSFDVKRATKGYEELLLPFVKKAQGGKAGNAMRYLNPQSQWGVNVRNAILWFVTRTKLVDLLMKLGEWFGFAEDKVSFPNYPWPK